MLLALILDLRRRRFLNILLTLLLVVMIDPEVSDPELSEELESSEDEDEFVMSAKTPGCDSSSMISCGVLSYRYA